MPAKRFIVRRAAPGRGFAKAGAATSATPAASSTPSRSPFLTQTVDIAPSPYERPPGPPPGLAPGRQPAGVTDPPLERELCTHPDATARAVEAARGVEEIVPRVERPRVLALRENAVAVAKPLLGPHQ